MPSAAMMAPRQLPMFGQAAATGPPPESFFATHTIDDLLSEMLAVYQQATGAVVLAYSGGKDSTLALDLLWRAIALLPAEERRAHIKAGKLVHVLSSDTQIEQPAIITRLRAHQQALSEAIEREEMPFTADIVARPLRDSFWVCLLGRGYAAPTPLFRWCTSRLKVNPITSYLSELLEQYGTAVVITGARKAESTARATSMAKSARPGEVLSPSRATPGALMYNPIRDWTVGDLWRWLDSHKCPWTRDSYWDLMAIYESADKECPLVMTMDKRDSCGGTRTGCLVCPVVGTDHSLAALIEKGADYLEPMMALRTLLVETGKGDERFRWRGIRGGTDYSISLSSKGTEKGQLSPRLYTMEARRFLLQQTLYAQAYARAHGPDPHFTLLADDELREIQRLWFTEWGDWDLMAQWIASEVQDISGWAWHPHPQLTRTRKRQVEERARDLDVPEVLLLRLVTYLELLRDEPTVVRARLVSKALAKLVRADWLSDGKRVSTLYWQRDEESEAEEARARAQESRERARTGAQLSFAPLAREEGDVAPLTQADQLVEAILALLARDTAGDPVRVLQEDPARAALVGSVDWEASLWMTGGDRARRSTVYHSLYCHDGSQAYRTPIYGTGAALHDQWASYPAAPDLAWVARAGYTVLGHGKSAYRAVAYTDGRWRRFTYSGRGGFWLSVDDDTPTVAPWCATPEHDARATLSELAERLRRVYEEAGFPA
jgi:DNA sulfur modification protein DndC